MEWRDQPIQPTKSPRSESTTPSLEKLEVYMNKIETEMSKLIYQIIQGAINKHPS